MATLRYLDWNCRLGFHRILRRAESAELIDRNCFHRRKISSGDDCPSSSNRRIFGFFWHWPPKRCADAFAKFHRKSSRSNRCWSNCRCNRYCYVRHYFACCCLIRSVLRHVLTANVAGWIEHWMKPNGSNANVDDDGGGDESRED